MRSEVRISDDEPFPFEIGIYIRYPETFAPDAELPGSYISFYRVAKQDIPPMSRLRVEKGTLEGTSNISVIQRVMGKNEYNEFKIVKSGAGAEAEGDDVIMDWTLGLTYSRDISLTAGDEIYLRRAERRLATVNYENYHSPLDPDMSNLVGTGFFRSRTTEAYIVKPDDVNTYPPEVIAILDSGVRYTDLTREEKELLKIYVHLREDTAAVCSQAGMSIRESIPYAIIMQMLNISYSDVCEMAKNHGDVEEALSQAWLLVMTQFDFHWFASYHAAWLPEMLVTGYTSPQTTNAYIAAYALEADLREIISKEKADFSEASHLTEAERRTCMEISDMYYLKAEFVLDYLEKNNLTPDELMYKLDKFRISNNLVKDDDASIWLS